MLLSWGPPPDPPWFPFVCPSLGEPIAEAGIINLVGLWTDDPGNGRIRAGWTPPNLLDIEPTPEAVAAALEAQPPPADVFIERFPELLDLLEARLKAYLPWLLPRIGEAAGVAPPELRMPEL